jgi:hypothetical protein
LGIGSANQGVTIPVIVPDLDGMNIISTSAFKDRSAIINSKGELFTWGSAKNGSMLQADGRAYPDNLLLPTIFEDTTTKFT